MGYIIGFLLSIILMCAGGLITLIGIIHLALNDAATDMPIDFGMIVFASGICAGAVTILIWAVIQLIGVII